MVVLQFSEEPLYCSSQQLYQFAFLSTVQEGFLFSTHSSVFILCGLFDGGHSDWCEVTLLLISLTTSNVEHFLMCQWATCMSSLKKCLFSSSAHFLSHSLFVLILSYMSHQYIFKINLLSVELFANIFSQSIGCLFILFMVSFAVQKLLKLISCLNNGALSDQYGNY